jgi:predicted kinase
MQAVIFIGVQATGKSTFFKERFADTHVRINLDMLKTRHREKLILEACLQAGQSFVIDNTNPTVADRQRYIVPARAAQFEVIGYYFRSELTTLLKRNQQRIDKPSIPVAGVQGAYRKLQVSSQSEGFNQLFYVKIDPQGVFLVEELIDEGPMLFYRED